MTRSILIFSEELQTSVNLAALRLDAIESTFLTKRDYFLATSWPFSRQPVLGGAGGSHLLNSPSFRNIGRSKRALNPTSSEGFKSKTEMSSP
jgi:hypothetical protein